MFEQVLVLSWLLVFICVVILLFMLLVVVVVYVSLVVLMCLLLWLCVHRLVIQLCVSSVWVDELHTCVIITCIVVGVMIQYMVYGA